MYRSGYPVWLVVVVLLVVGCSGSDDTTAADSTTAMAAATTHAPSSTAAPPTSEASLADAIAGLADAKGHVSTTAPTTTTVDPGPAGLQRIADDAGVVALIVVTDDAGIRSASSGQTVDGQPVTADGAFQVQSVTKMLTAVAVMSLVDDGVVSLDDPVADYVGFEIYPDITIRHLLTHQSGIVDVFPGMTCDASSVAAGIEEIAAAALAFEPGSMSLYSDTGYMLLGMVIGAVTADDSAAVFGDAIFDPLAMTSTYFLESQDGPTPFHDIDEGWICPGNTVTFRTGGGLVSTAGDLDAFLRGLFEGDLVTEASREAMLEIQSIVSERPCGLGIEALAAEDGRTVYGHTGYWDAFGGQATGAFYDPTSSRTIVIFAQESREPLLDTLWEVADWAEAS